MSLSYNKLWKLLIDKKMKKTELMNLVKLSPNTLAKLGQDKIVDMQTLFKICDTLNCNITDIMEYTPDKECDVK